VQVIPTIFRAIFFGSPSGFAGRCSFRIFVGIAIYLIKIYLAETYKLSAVGEANEERLKYIERGYIYHKMSSDELASDMVRSSILMILYEKPLHGYAIMSRVKNRLGKTVSPSLIYPFLHQLEEKGLVSSSLKPVGRKPKKVYELTDEGRQLATLLFKRLASLVSVAIEPNLTICTNCGAKLYAGGHKEVIDGKEVMFCCIHCFEAYKQERDSIATHRIDSR